MSRDITDIFLSYDDQDRPRARVLVEELESRGWSTFWDRSIPAGRTWWQVLGRALKRTRCVVVLWSETAVHSTWVYEEAEDGRKRGILIPVLIDPVTQPMGFRSLQAVDLSGWDGSKSDPAFHTLLAAIEDMVGAQGKPHEESATGDDDIAPDDIYDSGRFFFLLVVMGLASLIAYLLW